MPTYVLPEANMFMWPRNGGKTYFGFEACQNNLVLMVNQNAWWEVNGQVPVSYWNGAWVDTQEFSGSAVPVLYQQSGNFGGNNVIYRDGNQWIVAESVFGQKIADLGSKSCPQGTFSTNLGDVLVDIEQGDSSTCGSTTTPSHCLYIFK